MGNVSLALREYHLHFVLQMVFGCYGEGQKDINDAACSVKRWWLQSGQNAFRPLLRCGSSAPGSRVQRACFHCWSVLPFLLLWCSFLRDAVYIWPNRGIIITTVLLSLPPNFGTLLPFSYQITDMSSVFEGEKLDSLQVAPTRCLSICWIAVDDIVKI